MMYRIRYALRDPMFAHKLGGGGATVEADETYVGPVGNVISEFLMQPSSQSMGGGADDAVDLAIARKRLAEIDANPERLMRGSALEAKMRRWES